MKSLLTALGLAVLGLAAGCLSPAAAEHLVETTYEVRTLLYFDIPEAELKPLLPEGWNPVAFDAGPGKGADLTLNLSEQLFATDAAGKASPDRRANGLTLSARVRDPKTGEPRAMVLFGMTNGADTPGPYGAHRPAAISLTRQETNAGGATATGKTAVPMTTMLETWKAEDSKGDMLSLSLSFERGPLATSHTEQQTRSALHPDFYRIYKLDLLAGPVRSEALHLDRVKSFSLSAGGDVQKILSAHMPLAIVSIPVYRRGIYLPDQLPGDAGTR